MNNFLMVSGAALIAASTFYGLADHGSNLRVIDGDTIAFGDRHVRLWGIDAPELSQVCRYKDGSDYPCGDQARVHLQNMIAGGTVSCKLIEHDKYGREVSTCSVTVASGATFDLGGGMVRTGFALDWPRYSSGFYGPEQQAAKSDGAGMWGGTFELPWEYRWRAQPKP